MDRGYRVVPSRIRRLRGARGWNQKRYAEECGLHQGLVNRIEKGHVPSPQRETLEKMAYCLGVTVEDLIEPSDEPIVGLG